MSCRHRLGFVLIFACAGALLFAGQSQAQSTVTYGSASMTAAALPPGDAPPGHDKPDKPDHGDKPVKPDHGDKPDKGDKPGKGKNGKGKGKNGKGKGKNGKGKGKGKGKKGKGGH